jgi:hypothetical protein
MHNIYLIDNRVLVGFYQAAIDKAYAIILSQQPLETQPYNITTLCTSLIQDHVIILSFNIILVLRLHYMMHYRVLSSGTRTNGGMMLI